MTSNNPNDDGLSIRNTRYPRNTFDEPPCTDTIAPWALLIIVLIAAIIAALSHIKHLDNEIENYKSAYSECVKEPTSLQPQFYPPELYPSEGPGRVDL